MTSLMQPMRGMDWEASKLMQPTRVLLKCNKYVCILSIAVTPLLYIMTKYDYHI